MSQWVTYGHFYDDKLKSGITVASLINEALGEKVKITVLEATDRLHGRLQTVDLDGIKVWFFSRLKNLELQSCTPYIPAENPEK